MADSIEFIGIGKPIPIIYTLVSFYIPYSFGEEGHVRFKGSYRIIDRKEPTQTELDEYEKDFILPQPVIMIHRVNAKQYNYSIEIYKRSLHDVDYKVDSPEGIEQTIYYRIVRVI